jgi:protein-S-isoprenylcysteine O-methyltransferase Ste14
LSIALLWTILFYGWTASEVCLVLVTGTRRSGGKMRDRGSLLVLWGTILSAITVAEWLAPSLPGRMFPGAHWVKYAAIGLMIAGLMVRWTAILSLGKAFSVNVAIRPTQTVYQSGLYHIVRHPSYSGMLLIFAAVALANRNWIAAAIVLLPVTAALLYRIHVEEAAMREAFGEQYEAYCRATKRLIPAIY